MFGDFISLAIFGKNIVYARLIANRYRCKKLRDEYFLAIQKAIPKNARGRKCAGRFGARNKKLMSMTNMRKCVCGTLYGFYARFRKVMRIIGVIRFSMPNEYCRTKMFAHKPLLGESVVMTSKDNNENNNKSQINKNVDN